MHLALVIYFDETSISCNLTVIIGFKIAYGSFNQKERPILLIDISGISLFGEYAPSLRLSTCLFTFFVNGMNSIPTE